jgi:hypothetical protein
MCADDAVRCSRISRHVFALSLNYGTISNLRSYDRLIDGPILLQDMYDADGRLKKKDDDKVSFEEEYLFN